MLKLEDLVYPVRFLCSPADSNYHAVFRNKEDGGYFADPNKPAVAIVALDSKHFISKHNEMNHSNEPGKAYHCEVMHGGQWVPIELAKKLIDAGVVCDMADRKVGDLAYEVAIKIPENWQELLNPEAVTREQIIANLEATPGVVAARAVDIMEDIHLASNPTVDSIYCAVAYAGIDIRNLTDLAATRMICLAAGVL